MCGIVGYVGQKKALSVIIGGLEKLEYRGYDSAGVALYESGGVVITRAQGKLSQLKNKLEGKESSANLGLGHTRWATHGRPSETNAHPHSAGRVSIIHNGIIENYIQLKDELIKSGVRFLSETDTEIAAHLFDLELTSGKEPLNAFRSTCAKLRGSYALLAIDKNSPDRIFVAKTATPIVIGVGEGEAIVASDIPALLEYTRKVIILEDGDIAEVRADGILIENAGSPVKREVHNITWDAVTAQKGGYKHFMLKEIYEQSSAITDTLRGRVNEQLTEVVLPELHLSKETVRSIERIVMVACGTAWHACLTAKFFIEKLAKIPCEVDYASEFRYRDQPLNKKTLVLAISQSGETADTVAAIEKAAKESPTMAICNVLGSSLTRKVQHVLYTHAGPEISVASTKAFTTQLTAVYLFALFCAQERGTLNAEELATLIQDLINVPSAVGEALKLAPAIEKTAKEFHKSKDFLFLGRGALYPIALEGALKLKEISYIHAEGYPAGEIKHGPISLIDEKMPVVMLLQRNKQLFEKTLSNLREVESREGKVISFSEMHNHTELKKHSQSVIEVPYVSDLLSTIVMTIPLQFLAYYVAVFNGTDVDLPRNLAKSVTVE